MFMWSSGSLARLTLGSCFRFIQLHRIQVHIFHKGVGEFFLFLLEPYTFAIHSLLEVYGSGFRVYGFLYRFYTSGANRMLSAAWADRGLQHVPWSRWV